MNTEKSAKFQTYKTATWLKFSSCLKNKIKQSVEDSVGCWATGPETTRTLRRDCVSPEGCSGNCLGTRTAPRLLSPLQSLSPCDPSLPAAFRLCRLKLLVEASVGRRAAGRGYDDFCFFQSSPVSLLRTAHTFYKAHVLYNFIVGYFSKDIVYSI